MVHKTDINNSIGTQKSVYWDSSLGNLEHFAVGFEKFLELAIRNSADFLVDGFQFLDRNISVMRFGKVYDFFGNLTASCLGKVLRRYL